MKNDSNSRKNDYKPVHWLKYFDIKEDIEIDTDVYDKFILTTRLSEFTEKDSKKMLTNEVNCQCIAVDVRGHGDTRCTDESNLSIEILAEDIKKIVFSLYPAEAPPIILVGHSMGGAVAVHVAASRSIPSLAGLCVIDVVEVPDLKLSKVSIVQLNGGQLKRSDSGETATSELDKYRDENDEINDDNLNSQKEQSCADTENLSEFEVNPTEKVQETSSMEPEKSIDAEHESKTDYTWRIDLRETKEYWPGWFDGMSKKFLSVPEPKCLIVAGVDRLDKELTIGQMQGKFQMHVLSQVGHVIHEDNPVKTMQMETSQKLQPSMINTLLDNHQSKD